MTISSFERDRVALANTMMRMAKILASVDVIAAPSTQKPSVKDAMQNDPKLAQQTKDTQALAPMVEALQKFPEFLNKSLNEFATKYGKQVQDTYGASFLESAKSFIADFTNNMNEFIKSLQGEQTKFSKKAKVTFRENVELPQ